MSRGPGRRAVLRLAASSATAGVAVGLVGCSTDAGPGPPAPSATSDPQVKEVRYGPDPAQVVRVSATVGVAEPRGLVVLLHGGFWRAEYTAELADDLAADLARRGWTAANVEYRRVGDGGGFPETFDDVSAALDALGDQVAPGRPVVTLGHSAGGQLAVWLTGRHRLPRWSGARVRPTHAVSQAGVLDLVAAAEQRLGGGAVPALLGGSPQEVPDAYDAADPTRQLPPGCPVRCVHGTDDTTVPLSQSADYVRAATAAGGEATLVEVPGDHFALIDPTTPAWARTLVILDGLT